MLIAFTRLWREYLHQTPALGSVLLDDMTIVFLGDITAFHPIFAEADKGIFIAILWHIYTPKDEPQPQVFVALGLLNVKPRPFKPSVKSSSTPIR